MRCVVDLPAPDGQWLAYLLIAFAVISFLCLVPAAITQHRARWWLLVATVLLVGIAIESFSISSFLGPPSIAVTPAGITVRTASDQVILPLDAPQWTGLHRSPPAGLTGVSAAGQDDDGTGWFDTPTGERLFVAAWADPALLDTDAGFDLVLDWETVIELETCVSEMESAAAMM